MLLLVAPRAGNRQEGEPGEITDPHKTFSNEPWPRTLGLGWEKPFSRTCFGAVGSCLWLEVVVPGGFQCLLPSGTQLPLGEKMYNASVLKND